MTLDNTISRSRHTRDMRRISPSYSRLDWFVALLVLTVQQNAFIWTPTIMQTDPTLPSHESDSPFNYGGLIASMLLIAIRSIHNQKKIANIIINNPIVFVYILLVLASAFWSLHSDLTLKRGFGYVLTIFAATYLCTAFSIDDCIRVVSQSLVISAVGSIIFTYARPEFGIMWEPGTEGNWRGVFPFKNVLGQVMATGLLIQLYLVAARIGRVGWRILWILAFLGLVFRSKSGNSIVTSSIYLSMFIIYFAWSKNKTAGYAVAALFVFIAFGIAVALLIDPDSTLGLLGKDATLTGRTELWAEVFDLIRQKPLLGWGFRAMFVFDDPMTITINERIGWAAPNAHNSLLEVTLELGIVGLFAILIMIGTAIFRGVRCCLAGVLPLGYFSLVFFIGILLEGWTEATVIGLNQDIGWLIFNILAFACGQALSSQTRPRPAKSIR